MKILLHTFIVLSALVGFAPTGALAQADLSCDAESQVNIAFDNGARWDFCWKSRIRENLDLNEITYTTPAGVQNRILSSARLAQLHVAYDDNNVTYNDVTEFGLGGSYITELTQQDCPAGELINIQTRPGICVTPNDEWDSYRTPSRAVKAQSVNIFSISQVGAYAYIVSWTFYDNGAIEPAIGATGALQRSSTQTDSPFGRILEGDPGTLWLSHTHNYYWRLDFDLGASATDDRVTEIKYPLAIDGRRASEPRLLEVEEALRIDPASYQNWSVWDTEPTHLMDPQNSDAALAWGYQIEPVHYGHRLVRELNEPYTGYDFFVTVVNNCERFASQNARFHPDCNNNVLQYADTESLENQDLVVWHRVSFHHTPRNEDQRNMHTHWDGFVLDPINLLNSTSSYDYSATQPPTFSELNDLQNRIGDSVELSLMASEPSGAQISYRAISLPPGIELATDGSLTGEPTAQGVFNATVYATANNETSMGSFNWTITERRRNSSSDNLLGSVNALLLLFFGMTLAIRRSFARVR